MCMQPVCTSCLRRAAEYCRRALLAGRGQHAQALRITLYLHIPPPEPGLAFEKGDLGLCRQYRAALDFHRSSAWGEDNLGCEVKLAFSDLGS